MVSLTAWPPLTSRRSLVILGVALLVTLAYLGPTFTSLGHVFSSLPWDYATYDPDQPRMIIMQHFSWHDGRTHRLQDLSRDQHDEYSRIWGYQYHYADAQYVEAYRHPRLRYMNKMYALLELVIQQQALGDRAAEWVFLTDADVLITNPQIPIHALLPPSSAPSPVLIVGCEDWNGFNAGNVLYRVSLELVTFLSHTLAIADEMTRTYHAAVEAGETIAEGNPAGEEEHEPGVEQPPSDQRAQCLALTQLEQYNQSFYPVPDYWINAYPWYDQNEIQLNTHLVGGNKFTDDLSGYIQDWYKGVRLVRQMGGDKRQEVERWRVKAREYWQGATISPPKCDWI